MSDPVKQHVIPRFYLDQWADPAAPGKQRYVWQFIKSSRKGRRAAAHKILTVKDIYTLEFRNGARDYRIEKDILGRIESEYARVYYEKISKRLPLTENEHTILCAFVALMLQRTEGMKENIERFYDQIIERTEALEKQHNAPAKESIRLRTEKRNAHRKTMVQMLPDTASMLASMSVAFLCCERSGAFFITSDEPCQLFNPALQWQRFYGPGLKQRHIEVTMSLSPTVKVLFSYSNYKGYSMTTKSWVEESNRMIRGHTRKYFISNGAKTKWRWYSKYPFSIRFMLRAFWNDASIWVRNKWLRRHYGRI